MTSPNPEPEQEPLSYDEVLEQQGGVIGRQQALAGGLTVEAWRWQRTAKRSQQLLPGVVVMHTGTPTFEEKVQAAILYGGQGAAVSGDALLHLLKPGRTTEPDTIDVAVAAFCQVAALAFFRPHRCSRLADLVHPVRT